jgi:hypothetical protein
MKSILIGIVLGLLAALWWTEAQAGSFDRGTRLEWALKTVNKGNFTKAFNWCHKELDKNGNVTEFNDRALGSNYSADLQDACALITIGAGPK